MKKRYTPYPEKELPVGTVIGIIALVIVIIAIASVVSNFNLGNSSNDNSKIAVNADSSVTIIMTGKEPWGVSTGITLAPGESVKVKYISGKIIGNNKNGFTAPIWGVSKEETHPSWYPLIPYFDEGLWFNAVCIILKDETGKEHIYSFKKNQYQLIVKNTADKPRKAILYYHDAYGYYDDNEGDAKFLVKKL